MATSSISALIRDLRRSVVLRDAASLSDGRLLEWFLDQREEAAFELLVRRHGPMVLGVCRRILHHVQDAEDAFQATFLVLMRKAASITKREMLGAWLYGVAYRIAVRAKAMTARRRTKERQIRELPSPDGIDQDLWHDLEPLLDQEVNRLPAKYRVPLILCELEGRGRKEVSQQLGLAEGTLSSRLARARDMLRKRLTARGLTLSSAALALALSQSTAPAAVSTPLVTATIKAATLFEAGQAAATSVLSAKVAALAQGALKALLVSKLKVGIVMLLGVGLLCAGVGAGVWTHQTNGARQTASGSDRSRGEESVGRLENGPREERAPLPRLDPGEAQNTAFPETDPDDDQPIREPGQAEPVDTDSPITEPPAALHCDAFYRKHLSARGLPILASDKVSDRALLEAAYLVNQMLESRPDIREALIQGDVRFIIMHPTEKTTDFPEQRDLEPKEYWDKVRGLGDRIRNCGEENLLRLTNDPCRGRVILIHQVAYAIYLKGFEPNDKEFKSRLKYLYNQAMARGLWKGTRAPTNPWEYWSEAVLSYFDSNRVRVRMNGIDIRVNTREELAAYDPGVFKLIDEVFLKTKWRYRPPDQRQ